MTEQRQPTLLSATGIIDSSVCMTRYDSDDKPISYHAVDIWTESLMRPSEYSPNPILPPPLFLSFSLSLFWAPLIWRFVLGWRGYPDPWRTCFATFFQRLPAIWVGLSSPWRMSPLEPRWRSNCAVRDATWRVKCDADKNDNEVIYSPPSTDLSLSCTLTWLQWQFLRTQVGAFCQLGLRRFARSERTLPSGSDTVLRLQRDFFYIKHLERKYKSISK